MRNRCRAELLAVGSEILLGQIQNAHAQFISQELAKHGLDVYHHCAIGDNETRLQAALKVAVERSNVVIITGGLGPTADDLTKESLAHFLGLDLVMSTEALEHLMQYFAHRKRSMPEENRKQALCVDGGLLIANPNGTAPGQYVHANGVHFFLLPGPPLEMQPMLRDFVVPRLVDIFGGDMVLVSRVLHFCGIGESDVDEQIQDLTVGENPSVAPLAGEGEMLLRITATAPNDAGARALIAPIEEELRRRFQDYIYGVDEDTLSSVVGKVLAARNQTLSVAESCTGGMLSQTLTDVPGSSTYFMGGVVAYANGVKESALSVPHQTLVLYGAVSEATAKAMAEGVRSRLHTDYGVSVTGVAGPTGGTVEKPVGLVYVGVSDGVRTDVFELRMRGSRPQIRLRTCKQALWRLFQRVQSDTQS